MGRASLGPRSRATIQVSSFRLFILWSVVVIHTVKSAILVFAVGHCPYASGGIPCGGVLEVLSFKAPSFCPRVKPHGKTPVCSGVGHHQAFFAATRQRRLFLPSYSVVRLHLIRVPFVPFDVRLQFVVWVRQLMPA